MLYLAERADQMQQSVNTGLPFLKKSRTEQVSPISVVGYGPSLLDTWKSITHPIIATSGAYDFLVSRDVIPDYYVAIDPQKHTVGLLRNPQLETSYLMASCLHPDFWSLLEGYSVKLWHLINGEDFTTIDWVKQHHPSGMDCLIGGGSTVAQRAMNVAAWMGYRRFNIFGMDCSFTANRHAGEHTGEAQSTIHVDIAGRTFKTTPQLIQSAQEMQQFLLTVDAEVIFHGDSLMSEIARTLQPRKRAL